MEHRAIVHGAGKVGGEPASRCKRQIEAKNAAGVVEADVVPAIECMTLARRSHVVVPIEAQLDRTSGAPRKDRRDAGDQRHLRFLAAEPAAHAPALDDDVVCGQAERMRDHVLHFAGTLHAALGATVVLRRADVTRELDLADLYLAYQKTARSLTGPDRSAEKPQRDASVSSRPRMRPSSSKPTSNVYSNA